MDFRITVENRGEVYRGINIGIPRSLYDSHLQSAVMKASRQVKMKGFRPGRVPPAIVAKMYAPELKAEVLNDLVQKALEQAYEEHKMSVVGVSSIEVQPEQEASDLEVQAQVAVFPEPEIKIFRDLEFCVEQSEINESVLSDYVQEFRESRSKLDPREQDAQVQDGDGVVVDREAAVVGDEGESSSKPGELILLAGRRAASVPEEMKKALIGSRRGDVLSVTVTHPDVYKAIPEFAGKTVHYKLTVKNIFRFEIPEIDQEMIQTVAKVDSLEEFREKLRQDLLHEVSNRFEVAREEKLFECLIEANPFEVPQELVDHEIRNLLIEMGALKREDRRAYDIDVERFRSHLGKRAEFRVRSGIILGKIREQENLTLDEADREAWIEKVCERDKISDREGFKKMIQSDERKDWFEDVVMREKVVKTLLEASKIKVEKKLFEV